MSEKLTELKQEAKELGIQFSPNIGEATLQEKIDKYYENEANTAKEEEVEDKATEGTKKPTKKSAQAIIAEQIREGRKPVVLKLTMVDKREASTATDAFFSNGDVQAKVPLDVFVEMPKVLVEQAKEAKALVHTNVGGQTISKYTTKYVVEYKED